MSAARVDLPHVTYLAETHALANLSRELADYNLYGADVALREGVAREGALWAAGDLADFGRQIGAADYLELGRQANHYPPEFDTHDRFGNRVDLVRYHPAYHQLMSNAIAQGIHSSPWTDPQRGAHVARAARFYLHAQVEAGHGCPITMTFASLPTLRQQPDLAAAWLPKIVARHYDARNVPVADKAGLTIGMAMTEKQGGSDVRANSTRAYPLAGGVFELVGHKYFVSAPMSDAFLVLAQAPAGLSCFLVPRWRPDGSKNPLQILRLKHKIGNVANASSEAELRGALAWIVGDEGRGVRTIIEMVNVTRFDCMLGSSASLRMASAQALHHCAMRSAFGKRLSEQPLMQNVLADLALESEAALTLSLRVARALDGRAADAGEEQFVRLATALGKYWICKRAPNHAYEAMECIGGSGVMEEHPLGRLYRDAPINAIWEGSGNVQCLDVLRALAKTPAVVDAFLAELALAAGGNAAFDRHVVALANDLAERNDLEYRARDLVERMALALQSSLLIRHAPSFVADAFCASRLAGRAAQHYGTLPKGVDATAIIARAWPDDGR